ncbi:acyl-CoA N-acyltransferase [Neoconidiobolus thromboides FSU 785]|nr:acyl-CoA N-acyltransferase [Neoconidiobolus thromboides FSU 785]
MQVATKVPSDLILESSRLILKPITIADGENLKNLFMEEEAMKDLPWLSKLPKGWTQAEIEERIAQHIELQEKNKKMNFHVFLKEGIEGNKEPVFIGCGGLATVDLGSHNGTVGIILHSKYQRGGYGTEVLFLVLKYSFEVMNLHRLAFETSPGNAGMRGWLENVALSRLESIIEELIFYNDSYYSLAVYPLFRRDWESKTKPNILKRISKHANIE